MVACGKICWHLVVIQLPDIYTLITLWYQSFPYTENLSFKAFLIHLSENSNLITTPCSHQIPSFCQ